MKRNAIGMPVKADAMLVSLPMEINGEMGYHEYEIEISDQALRMSGDPKGFFAHEIAQALFTMTEATDTPKDFWFLRLSKKFQQRFDMPEVVSFDGGGFL